MRYKELKQPLEVGMLAKLRTETKGYGKVRDFAKKNGIKKHIVSQMLFWEEATPTNIEKVRKALENL